MDEGQKIIIDTIREVIKGYKSMPNMLEYMKKHKPLMYTADADGHRAYIVDFRYKAETTFDAYKMAVQRSFHEPMSYFDIHGKNLK